MAFEGIAPPGWEDQVREMEKNSTVSNLCALAWHVKQQQVRATLAGVSVPVMEATQYGDQGGQLLVDLVVTAQAELQTTGQSIEKVCYDAACGSDVAINNILNEGQGIHIYQEQTW